MSHSQIPHTIIFKTLYFILQYVVVADIYKHFYEIKKIDEKQYFFIISFFRLVFISLVLNFSFLHFF